MLSMKWCWVWLSVITLSQIHCILIGNIYLRLNVERLTWRYSILYLPKYCRHKNQTGFWVHTLFISVKKKRNFSFNFVFLPTRSYCSCCIIYWVFSWIGMFVVPSEYKHNCNYFDAVPTKKYCEIFFSLWITLYFFRTERHLWECRSHLF